MSFYNVLKSTNHPLLAFHLGYRQSNLRLQQTRITHIFNGVNLFTACSRKLNVWRYSNGKEQELKAQIQYVISTNRNAFRC